MVSAKRWRKTAHFRLGAKVCLLARFPENGDTLHQKSMNGDHD